MAHTNVPSVGFVRYNGLTFPPPKSCRVVGVPIPDSSGRTTKYVAYTLSIETIFCPDDFDELWHNSYGTIDDCMSLVRRRLTKTGQDLMFTYQGLGVDININSAGVEEEGESDGVIRYDATFGPHPKILVWEPVGSNKAARVVWECEFVIPDICAAPAYTNSLSEYNWEANFSINEDGMTVRTVTGTIEIPMTRRGRGIPDTVDNYRELINFPRIPGFIRNEEYSISRDKRIMNFRITDVEIPSDNPLFPGIVDADVDHTVMSALNNGPMVGGFTSWLCSLRGTVRVAPGVPRNYLWLAILDIMYQRIVNRVPLGEASRITHDGQNIQQVPATWLPVSLELSEKLFSRELSFTFVYRLISSLNSIWATTGLLENMNGNWDVWTQSLSHLNTRGHAQLRHLTTDDQIIDLCDSAVVNANNLANKYRNTQQSIFNPDCPAPARSWLIFSPRLRVVESTETVFIPKATGVTAPEISSQQAVPAPQEVGGDFTGLIPSQVIPAEQPVVQGRGHSRWFLRFSGQGFRVCYKPKIPKVAKILGVPAVRVGEADYSIETLHPGSKFPIYHITWDILYALPGPIPGKLEDSVEIDGLAEDYR